MAKKCILHMYIVTHQSYWIPQLAPYSWQISLLSEEKKLTMIYFSFSKKLYKKQYLYWHTKPEFPLHNIPGTWTYLYTQLKWNLCFKHEIENWSLYIHIFYQELPDQSLALTCLSSISPVSVSLCCVYRLMHEWRGGSRDSRVSLIRSHTIGRGSGNTCLHHFIYKTRNKQWLNNYCIKI